MRPSSRFSRLAAACALSAGALWPLAPRAEEPPDTDEYVAVTETFLMACTRDGYMHYYGGPLYASLTDLRKAGKEAGDFDVAAYEPRLQAAFVQVVAGFDNTQVFRLEGVVAIDRALRAFAKTYEMETGVSSGFLAMTMDISRGPEGKSCAPGSPYRAPQQP